MLIIRATRAQPQKCIKRGWAFALRGSTQARNLVVFINDVGYETGAGSRSMLVSNGFGGTGL